MKTIEESILIKALATHLDCDVEDIVARDYDHYGLSVFEYGNEEYAVGTDGEADSAWDQALDSYIEEFITPELDKLNTGGIFDYIKFDEEMWKRDARMDGRGHCLSGYDGNEEDINCDNETLYIYRLS